MNDRFEKIAMLDKLVASFAKKFSPMVDAADYEIQDNFKCVLICAKVGGDFSLSQEKELEAKDIFQKLDREKIAWVVVFLNESGKMLDSLNGERQ